MKNLPIFLFASLLLFSLTQSCKKKPIVEETYWDKVRANQQECIDGFKASIRCDGISPNATSYFSANVAGDDVCFELGKDNYEGFSETGFYALVHGTVFSSENASNLIMFGLRPKSYQSAANLLRFEVRLASDEALPLEQMLDKYLVLGDLKMLDDSLENERFGKDGFFLYFVNTCAPVEKGDSTWTIIEGTGYKTNPSSFIRCDALTKTIGPSSITYDMTLAFEFQLYPLSFERKWLRKGKFRYQLIIPR